MEHYVEYLDESIRSEEKKSAKLKKNVNGFYRSGAIQTVNAMFQTLERALSRCNDEYMHEKSRCESELEAVRAQLDAERKKKQKAHQRAMDAAKQESEAELERIREEQGNEVSRKDHERQLLEERLTELQQSYADVTKSLEELEASHAQELERIHEEGEQTIDATVRGLDDEARRAVILLDREVSDLGLTDKATDLDNILFFSDDDLQSWSKAKLQKASKKGSKESAFVESRQQKMGAAVAKGSLEDDGEASSDEGEASSDGSGDPDATGAEDSLRRKLAVLLDSQKDALEDKIKDQEDRIQELIDAIRAKEKSMSDSHEESERLKREAARLSSRAENYEKYYMEERKKRRDLACEIMDIKGNIRVYCRIRPIIDLEREAYERSGSEGLIDCMTYPVPGEVSVRKDVDSCPDHYEFDQIFKPDSTQEEVFYEVYPYVQKLLDGYNVCIFAYGQTGSGKTFTMEGPPGDPGVNYRALGTLFEIAESRVAAYDYSFRVVAARLFSLLPPLQISVIEIYNERIYDLLVDPASTPSGALKADRSDDDDDNADIPLTEGDASDQLLRSLTQLRIRTNKNETVYLENLTQVPIESLDEAKAILDEGHTRRYTASHSLNEHSSRSHLIVTVEVVGYSKKDKKKIQGKLHLIDLAGSERVSKTEAEGQRLNEAKSINKSLSALGNVIKALGEAKSTHIPYRDTKLTHILKDSLCGNSKVLMFANVTPAQYNILETISSMQFASRCRRTNIGIAQQNVSRTSTTKAGRASVTMKPAVVERVKSAKALKPTKKAKL